eukprot:6610021-Prorocentrum_lima.AAC.1
MESGDRDECSVDDAVASEPRIVNRAIGRKDAEAGGHDECSVDDAVATEPLIVSPVSYTHLRAHETRRHL